MTGYFTWRRQRLERVTAGAEIIQTSRGPVEFVVVGEGPPVIISHGAFGGYDQGLWAREHIGLKAFKVIAPSRPGYLRTPTSSGRSWADQADLFASLLDTLHVETAAVVGISAGGMPAVNFAVRHPDRCTALVLWSAVTQPMRREARMAFMATPMHIGFELAAWSMLGWAFRAAARLNRWPNEEALTDLIGCTTPCLPRKAGWVADVRSAGIIDPEIHRQVTVPTLVLHARGDPIVPYHFAEATARSIAGSEIELYKGGTHVLAASHPESAERVTRFLRIRIA